MGQYAYKETNEWKEAPYTFDMLEELMKIKGGVNFPKRTLEYVYYSMEGDVECYPYDKKGDIVLFSKLLDNPVFRMLLDAYIKENEESIVSFILDGYKECLKVKLSEVTKRIEELEEIKKELEV